MSRLEWKPVHTGNIDPNAAFQTYMKGLQGADNAARNMRKQQMANDEVTMSGADKILNNLNQMHGQEMAEANMDLKKQEMDLKYGDGLEEVSPFGDRLGSGIREGFLDDVFNAGWTPTMLAQYPELAHKLGLDIPDGFKQAESRFEKNRDKLLDGVEETQNSFNLDYENKLNALNLVRDDMDPDQYEKDLNVLNAEKRERDSILQSRRQELQDRYNNPKLNPNDLLEQLGFSRNPIYDQAFNNTVVGEQEEEVSTGDAVSAIESKAIGKSTATARKEPPKLKNLSVENPSNPKASTRVSMSEDGRYTFQPNDGKAVTLDADMSEYLRMLSSDFGMEVEHLVGLFGGESTFREGARSHNGVVGFGQVTEPTMKDMMDMFPEEFARYKEELGSDMSYTGNPSVDRKNRYASALAGALYYRHLHEDLKVDNNPRDLYLAYNLGASGSSELRKALNDPEVDRNKTLKDLGIKITSPMEKNSNLYQSHFTLNEVMNGLSNLVGYNDAVERNQYKAKRGTRIQENLEDAKESGDMARAEQAQLDLENENEIEKTPSGQELNTSIAITKGNKIIAGEDGKGEGTLNDWKQNVQIVADDLNNFRKNNQREQTVNPDRLELDNLKKYSFKLNAKEKQETLALIKSVMHASGTGFAQWEVDSAIENIGEGTKFGFWSTTPSRLQVEKAFKKVAQEREIWSKDSAWANNKVVEASEALSEVETVLSEFEETAETIERIRKKHSNENDQLTEMGAYLIKGHVEKNEERKKTLIENSAHIQLLTGLLRENAETTANARAKHEAEKGNIDSRVTIARKALSDFEAKFSPGGFGSRESAETQLDTSGVGALNVLGGSYRINPTLNYEAMSEEDKKHRNKLQKELERLEKIKEDLSR